VDIYLESGEGERLEKGNNRVNDYAFFITSEITPSKKINIRPGLRFIKNSVYDAPPFIPSLNTKIVLTKDIDLRLSYAKGFRSPSLRELYFSFFDANHQVVGNPDLKAEISNSFTGSVNWKMNSKAGAVYTVAAGGFYNSVKNLIDYVFTQSSDTARLYNVADSKTGGLNINANWKQKAFSISAGASYTGFYNMYAATDKSLPELQWSPEANVIAGYSFSAIRLAINFFYKFTGKRPRFVANGADIILAKTDAFHMADFTVNKKLYRHFSLSAGIRNLFDTDRIQSSFTSGGIHSSGGLNVGTGRSFFTGIVFNWEKK